MLIKTAIPCMPDKTYLPLPNWPRIYIIYILTISLLKSGQLGNALMTICMIWQPFPDLKGGQLGNSTSLGGLLRNARWSIK